MKSMAGKAKTTREYYSQISLKKAGIAMPTQGEGRDG